MRIVRLLFRAGPEQTKAPSGSTGRGFLSWLSDAETGSNAPLVMPGTLYADRPGGESLFLDRLNRDDLGGFLRDRGLSYLTPAAPVVVMLDRSESRDSYREWCALVALEYGGEQPLWLLWTLVTSW